jgi:signal transduction histidine kinase
MRIHLRQKLILSHILPILIILPVFGFFLLSTLRAFYFDHLRDDLSQTGALLIDALQLDPTLANDNSRLQELLLRAASQIPARIQIIDQNGVILASTESEDVPLIGTISQENALKSSLAGKVSTEKSPSDVVTVAIPVASAGHIGAILLSLQTSDTDAMFTRLNQLVITGCLILTLLSLVISYIFGSTLSRSLRQLKYEAKSVAKGDYSHHVQAHGDIEVADLANYFNEMVDKLAEQRSVRQRLLDDIAHELRQPISAIRTAIEVVQGASADIPEQVRYLQNALLEEMDRLGRLTERLNLVSEYGWKLDLSKRTPVDISAMIKKIVVLFEPKADQLGIRLVSKLPATLPQVNADKDALAEIFTNLIENALKFTPGGGQVNVSAGKTQERIWIQVSDTGMDLTDEEQKRLFERFYRGDKTRSRPGGLGLGLAIVHELVKAHGGDIRVSSEPDQGTSFFVEFPL